VSADGRGGGGSGSAVSSNVIVGGTYGGGGAGSAFGTEGGGAVRIIWPGTSRSFPSTNTGDL
jgi:hypothetical protein